MRDREKLMTFLKEKGVEKAFYSNYDSVKNESIKKLNEEFGEETLERNLLLMAFVWTDSLEGFDFWETMNDDWNKYIVNKKV